jgi:lipoyl(octanoyl) transferase
VPFRPRVLDLGRLPYEDAYALQRAHLDEVFAARTACDEAEGGRILLVEHDPPVITVTRRPTAMSHLLASREQLGAAGVELKETDRGGDITYHGPGQLVVYPIMDLERLRIGLHDYMRLLEGAVIDTCADFGLRAERDPSATGVWVRCASPKGCTKVAGGQASLQARPPDQGAPDPPDPEGVIEPTAAPLRKICAMGVRVRRWITMHGLALNVATNLDHFGLIVPCGLSGRPVTSLQRELGAACPSMEAVKRSLVGHLLARLAQVADEKAAPRG